jgi:hypothetical protein
MASELDVVWLDVWNNSKKSTDEVARSGPIQIPIERPKDIVLGIGDLFC